YGNVDYWQEGLITSGWLYDDLQPFDWSMMFWWARLNDDPWFNDLATTRWRYMRENAFSNTNIQAQIDSLTGYIDAAQQRNFDRWPILGNYVWPNYNWQGNTYEDEVTYFSNWLFARLVWLDNNFNGNVLEPSVTISPQGRSGDLLLYQLDLADEYFTNHSLREKYFNLTTNNPLLFIDTVYHESASTATLALWVSPASSFGGSEFTVQIDDRILNGFRPLVTEEVTVDAGAPEYDDPFEVEIYSAGKSIMVRTNDTGALPDQMRIYNTAGILVEVHTLAQSGFNMVHTTLQPGIYILTLEASDAQTSPARQAEPVREKVFIR
ncbi:MAG: CotH kinase family protein, partial [Bacteroidales bacterium]|nr:CotH kinase family protein [Bacteroidales bacterium]